MDTNESLSVLFFLYATTGDSGQRICNLGSFSIRDQCLRSMCAMYLVLLYVMGKIGRLLVLWVVCMLSSSSCVLYFSALLKAVMMVSYLYPR